MQKLAPKRRHVAEWSHYQIVIDSRGERVTGKVFDLNNEEDFVEMDQTSGPRTQAQAVVWAAGMLEAVFDCEAIVDGKRHGLEDFLYFVPDGVL